MYLDVSGWKTVSFFLNWTVPLHIYKPSGGSLHICIHNCAKSNVSGAFKLPKETDLDLTGTISTS